MKGEHFIADLSGVDESQCCDTQLFINLSNDIADILEAKLIDTMSTCFTEPKPGCSVLTLLDKSHISFHSYSKEHVVSMDVFCCSTKDIEKKILPLLLERISHNSIRKFSLPRM